MDTDVPDVVNDAEAVQMQAVDLNRSLVWEKRKIKNNSMNTVFVSFEDQCKISYQHQPGFLPLCSAYRQTILWFYLHSLFWLPLVHLQWLILSWMVHTYIIKESGENVAL